MKYLKSTLAILLAVTLMLSMNAAVFAAERDTVPTGLCLAPADGVTTEISYENGGGYLADGAVDYAATERNAIIEQVESFDVQYGGEVILTVEPRDITAVGASQEMANGYYAITFPIPNSTKECFLTGLTPRNVTLVQDMLVKSYASGRDFSIEDVDFIDAEKLASKRDGDDNLCWAGAASNMLQYSGWGRKAGFETEDDIFETFIDAFEDEGGNTAQGIAWFFHGGGTSLKKTGSGKYLPNYDLGDLAGSGWDLSFERTAQGISDGGLKKMTDYLKKGYAVGLDVSWPDTDLGHSITLWGCITDNSVDDCLLAHYDSLIISDSDSNEAFGTDRRVAPNELDLYRVKELVEENDSFESISAAIYDERGIMTAYHYLAAYSDSIPFETDDRATRDFLNDPDYCITDAVFSSFDGYDETLGSRVYADQAYLLVRIFNRGEGEPSGDPVRIDYTVKDENGDVVLTNSDRYPLRREMSYQPLGKLSVLKDGSYTVEIVINPDASVAEALLYNNHYTTTFEVCGAAPDTEGVTLTADVGRFANGVVEVGIDCHGVEDTELYRGSDAVKLKVAHYTQGKWDVYSDAGSTSGEGKLPDTYRISTPIRKIRFALVFYRDGLSVTVESPAYDVYFPQVSLFEDAENPVGKAIIDADAGRFRDGGAYSFTLLNHSQEAFPEMRGKVAFYLVKSGEAPIYLGEPVPVTLKNGVRSEKFTLSSWEEDLELSGDYFVMARFVSDEIESFSVVRMLGLASTPETGSSVVTIGEDFSDPFDGKTSLREAVAYCELNGGVVTFAPGVAEVLLKEPITVTGKVVIDGMTTNDMGQCCAVLDGDDSTTFFIAERGGRLELRRMVLQLGASYANGGAIYCNGGELVTDQVYFRSNTAENGGAISFNGGRGKLSDTSFYNNRASFGADIYVDNGAEVEMLNGCSANAVVTGNGAVYNKSGRLNMINCAVADCEKDYGADISIDAVVSEGETNLVNCMVTDTGVEGCSVSGGAKVIASALKNADDGVTVDKLTEYYANGELIESSRFVDKPVIRFDYENARVYPALMPVAMNGWMTRVTDGEIILSKNGSLIPTGVKTAFTDAELGLDLFGDVRDRTFYGPCCRLSSTYEYVLGDADGDREVTVIDATVLQRYDAGMHSLSAGALTAADVDCDGDACIIDVTWIQRYDLGMRAPEGIGERFMR